MEAAILEYLSDGTAHTFREINDNTPAAPVMAKRNMLAALTRDGRVKITKDERGVPVRPPTYYAA
jgi:hypothetical protein